MKQSRISSFALIAAPIVLAAAINSCAITVANANRPPDVSLTASTNSAYSDQDVLFSATASDPNGDAISYAWSIDGIAQSDESGTSISRYWLTSSNISSSISVIVTDSQGASTAKSLTVNIAPAASLRVINNSSYPITQVYVTTHNAPWGGNYLGSTPIPSGYYYTAVGIQGGFSYDFEAVLSTGLVFDTTAGGGIAMYAGYYCDYTITNTTASVSAPSTAVSVKSLAAAGSKASPRNGSAASVDLGGRGGQLHKNDGTPAIEPSGVALSRR